MAGNIQLLTRLRLGWSSLAATQARMRQGPPTCRFCGAATEDRDHYLLHCQQWLPQRDALTCQLAAADVPPCEPGPGLTSKLLLGGADLPHRLQAAVATATQQFITATRRFDPSAPWNHQMQQALANNDKPKTPTSTT